MVSRFNACQCMCSVARMSVQPIPLRNVLLPVSSAEVLCFGQQEILAWWKKKVSVQCVKQMGLDVDVTSTTPNKSTRYNFRHNKKCLPGAKKGYSSAGIWYQVCMDFCCCWFLTNVTNLKSLKQSPWIIRKCRDFSLKKIHGDTFSKILEFEKTYVFGESIFKKNNRHTFDIELSEEISTSHVRRNKNMQNMRIGDFNYG